MNPTLKRLKERITRPRVSIIVEVLTSNGIRHCNYTGERSLEAINSFIKRMTTEQV